MGQGVPKAAGTTRSEEEARNHLPWSLRGEPGPDSTAMCNGSPPELGENRLVLF